MSNKKPENGNNAEWRGWAKAKLELIPEIKKDVCKIDAKVNGMMLKVAGLSGIVSVVVTLVVALLIFALKGS